MKPLAKLEQHFHYKGRYKHHVHVANNMLMAMGYPATQIEFLRQPTKHEEHVVLECLSFQGGWVKYPGKEWQEGPGHYPCRGAIHPVTGDIHNFKEDE